MKKNDCYTCPHREQVPGSAHSRCKAIKSDAVAFEMAKTVASGSTSGISAKVNGEKKAVLKFDPNGVRSGWCAWPVNFDPVCVECYLPIENNDKQ
jgi:hypothetical protein